MDIELQQAYEKYCNLVYSYLLTNCPVDTGNMITHIRMNNDGIVCRIVIDTIPYSKAGKGVMRKMRKKQHRLNPIEVEYAVYTEYPWIHRKGHNPNEGWIRYQSLLPAAMDITPNVRYLLGD